MAVKLRFRGKSSNELKKSIEKVGERREWEVICVRAYCLMGAAFTPKCRSVVFLSFSIFGPFNVSGTVKSVVMGEWMGRMITRHRHTESEIATKLATAEGMAAQGVLHRDIAKLLGISVMTYHRWRKARGATTRSPTRLTADPEQAEVLIGREEVGQIRELKIENSRLRRLVADLLLEKLELEESLRGVSENRTQLGHRQYRTTAARQIVQK